MDELVYKLKVNKSKLNKDDYKRIKKIDIKVEPSKDELRVISEIIDNSAVKFTTSEYLELMNMVADLYNGHKPCKCRAGSYEFCVKTFKDLYKCKNRGVIMTTFPLIKYFFYVMNISPLEPTNITIQELPQHYIITSQSEYTVKINNNHITKLLSVLIDDMFDQLTDIKDIFVYMICIIDGIFRVSYCIKDENNLFEILLDKIRDMYRVSFNDKSIIELYKAILKHYSCKTNIIEQWLSIV